MFGYSIPINFNKEGDFHTTFAGGFVSLILKFAIGSYIFRNCYKMFSYDDDTVTSAYLKLDLADPEEGAIKHN